MTNSKKKAHIIFKRLKACAFNIEIYKKRFGEPTQEERNIYNKFYGSCVRI